MKVRQGFVSNSSTSSFCAYGVFVSLDTDKPLEVAKAIKKKNPKVYKEFIDSMFEVEDGEKLDPKQVLLYEWLLKPEEFKKAITIKVRCCGHPETKTKCCAECGQPMWERFKLTARELASCFADYEMLELFEEALGKHSLLTVMMSEYGAYIGREYDTAPDNMTFGKFKKETAKALEEMGIKEKPKHINEEVHYV